MKSLIFILLISATSAWSITFKEWSLMSVDKKASYLDSANPDLTAYLVPKKKLETTMRPERLKKIDTQIKLLSAKLTQYKPPFSLEAEDDYHATVGPVNQQANIYFSSDDKLIAVTFIFIQKGCSHLDKNGNLIEKTGHYKTPSEAKKNNCIDNDVSWSGSSTIDHNFRPLYDSGYMDWTGH